MKHLTWMVAGVIAVGGAAFVGCERESNNGTTARNGASAPQGQQNAETASHRMAPQGAVAPTTMETRGASSAEGSNSASGVNGITGMPTTPTTQPVPSHPSAGGASGSR